MMEKYILSNTPSKDFDNAIECAGGYCTFEGKFLLLKRNPKKLFGNMWGVPGGKVESGETLEEGLIREVYEEVGIEIDKSVIEPIHTLYIQSADSLSHIVIYHMFYCPLIELPELSLHLEEHLEAQWVTPSEGFRLSLVSAGGREALEIYQNFLERRKGSSL